MFQRRPGKNNIYVGVVPSFQILNEIIYSIIKDNHIFYLHMAALLRNQARSSMTSDNNEVEVGLGQLNNASLFIYCNCNEITKLFLSIISVST